MTKLKLGPLVDGRPVKLTIELPASVHRDLVAYGGFWHEPRAPHDRSNWSN
jgi:hypothetical protein